jgi:hypothetical protein
VPFPLYVGTVSRTHLWDGLIVVVTMDLTDFARFLLTTTRPPVLVSFLLPAMPPTLPFAALKKASRFVALTTTNEHDAWICVFCFLDVHVVKKVGLDSKS